MTTRVLNNPVDFANLRRLILERGLMKRQPVYYVYKISEVGIMYAIGIAVLFTAQTWWVHVLNAVYMAFVFGQAGYLGHDAGHRQIFGNEKKDDILGYFLSCFTGLSARHWIDKHNEHHAHTNREDLDPQNNVSVMAFSENQARAKRGFYRFMTRHQAWFFFPLLSFSMLQLRFGLIKYFLQSDFKRVWRDITIVIGHLVVYVVLLFWLLPWWVAVLFIVIHQGLWGLYMGLAFAPNHKGMEVFGKDEKIDYLRAQVLTSRNVRPSPLNDYLYGGLNYQIEHHLFPNMPRNNLGRAREIVREFCKSVDVSYHETGVIRSYREIISHMKQVGNFTLELEI